MLLKTVKELTRSLTEERYYNGWMDNINTNNYHDRQLFIKRIMMKLNTKHKAKIRREVDLELGVTAPRRIVFKSKKIYTRKSKHKNRNDEK